MLYHSPRSSCKNIMCRIAHKSSLCAQQMAELEQQRRARESHMNALARQVEALRKECKRAQDEAKALGARYVHLCCIPLMMCC